MKKKTIKRKVSKSRSTKKKSSLKMAGAYSSPKVREPRIQKISPEANHGQMGLPIPEDFDAYNFSYSRHVWVYACAYEIASNIASVPIMAWKKNKDGEWEKDESNPFLKVLEQPNPYFTSVELKHFLGLSLALTGNAYWALERLGTNDIQEIWPLPANNVKAVTSREKFIDHYIYEVGGEKIRFELNEIIQFKDPSPTSFHYGQGSLSAAVNTVTTDVYTQVWNKNFFKNSARPDTVLETDTVLSDSVANRVKASWRKLYQGFEKRGETAVLEGGLKVHDLSSNRRDMEFTEGRKMAREEILAAFGVPPVLVGVFEYANYANSKEQIKIFWQNKLIPRLRLIEETLTMRVSQIRFDKRISYQHILENVEALRADLQMLSQTSQTFVNIGIPLNQVIDRLDLPFDAVDGGDESRPASSPFTLPPAKTVKALPQKVQKAELKEDMDVDNVKDIAWRAFDAKLESFDVRMERAVRAFFKAQHRRVKEAWKENANKILNGVLPEKSIKFFSIFRKAIDPSDAIEIIFDIGKEEEAMKSATGEIIEGAFFDFALGISENINPDFDFNLSDPAALAWLESKKLSLVQQANKFTKDEISDSIVSQIKESIDQGFSEAETIQGITDRIDDIFDFSVKGRANRIARTEMLSASNAGSFNAMKQTGVEKKEWLTSRDSKVRDTHKAMNGQTVKLDEPFLSPSGVKLQYPGDPSAGAASEIINCRCTPLPVIE